MALTTALSKKTLSSILEDALGKSLSTAAPTYDRIRTVGQTAYVHIPGPLRMKGDKLAPRAVVGKLVGFEGNHIYRVYIPERQTIIRSRDVSLTGDLPITTFDRDEVATTSATSEFLGILPPTSIIFPIMAPLSPPLLDPQLQQLPSVHQRPPSPPVITVMPTALSPPDLSTIAREALQLSTDNGPRESPQIYPSENPTEESSLGDDVHEEDFQDFIPSIGQRQPQEVPPIPQQTDMLTV